MGGVRRVPLALLLGAVTLVTLGAASCGDEESPIALADAGRGSVAEIVDAPATVTARAAATLTAPADGTLASMSVEPGDTVGKGQVLAVIDSPAARKRLRDARAALDAAKRAGGGFGGGSSGLSRVQDATDKAAADAFEAARGAAGKVAEPALRKALLAQVTAAERRYASASAAAQDAVGAVRRGVAGLSSAMSALSAAQRLQAQQAYDLAKSTVDALTLRAPVAGVVQLGGTASPSAGAGDLAALLGAAGPDLAAAAPAPTAARRWGRRLGAGRRPGHGGHPGADRRGRLRARPGRRGGRDRRAARRARPRRDRGAGRGDRGHLRRPGAGGRRAARRSRPGAAWPTGCGSRWAPAGSPTVTTRRHPGRG